ncbi:MAG TPA: aldo/keto reductase, partial [Acidimicrobiales bacterium]|nr:aldo/keto reductase [Acidimicrobiales bacterium]
TEVSDDDAAATVEAAWKAGIRVFDTAPLYGHGLAERRVGRALAARPRHEYVLSTKVGRLLVEGTPDPSTGFRVSHAVVPRFDFSADGVQRSLEESLDRLGLDRVDVALIHDPDDHLEQAITEAAPALAHLRDAGVVRAIGFGMNHVGPLAEAVERCDLDVILVAGRYTLLDQAALDGGLFARCSLRGVAVMAGGVFNSGVLAAPSAGSTYDYRPVDDDRLRRARAIADLCAAHGTSLPAAALQLVIAQPAVRTVLIGAREADEIEQDVRMAATPIDDALWPRLRSTGLLPDHLPTPDGWGS